MLALSITSRANFNDRRKCRLSELQSYKFTRPRGDGEAARARNMNLFRHTKLVCQSPVYTFNIYTKRRARVQLLTSTMHICDMHETARDGIKYLASRCKPG